MTAASSRRSERNGALNQQIAEMLGYRVFQTERDAGGIRYWDCAYPDGSTWHIRDDESYYVRSEDEAWWNVAPDFAADLNAIAAVLSHHDITLRLDFGPVLAARIIPESYVGEPELPEFAANSALYWTEQGEHADISELAALACADWLTWLREQGGTPP